MQSLGAPGTWEVHRKPGRKPRVVELMGFLSCSSLSKCRWRVHPYCPPSSMYYPLGSMVSALISVGWSPKGKCR